MMWKTLKGSGPARQIMHFLALLSGGISACIAVHSRSRSLTGGEGGKVLRGGVTN